MKEQKWQWSAWRV